MRRRTACLLLATAACAGAEAPDAGPSATPDAGAPPGLVGEDGTLTLSEDGFWSPDVAFSSDGAAHLVYVSGVRPQHLVYGTCAGRCEVSTSWSLAELVVADALDGVRMFTDPAAVVHLVYSGTVGGSSKTGYGRCSSRCTDPERWAWADLTARLEGAVVDFLGTPLQADGAGGAAVVAHRPEGGVRLALCSEGCEDPARWVVSLLRETGRRASLGLGAFAAHMVVHEDDGQLVYRSCMGACNTPGGWEESPPLFVHAGPGSIALAVVGAEVRLAYNQGLAPAALPPEVHALDNQLVFRTCNANCLEDAGWSLAALGPGNGEYLGIAALGRFTGLAITRLDRTLGVALCQSGCGDVRGWVLDLRDTPEALDAVEDPYDRTCDGERPYLATWAAHDPRMAVSPITGSGLYAYTALLTRLCRPGGTEEASAGFGRVVYIP